VANNSATYLGVALPAEPTLEQQRLLSALKFLSVGVDRMREVQVKLLLLNFEMMAFATTWFGLVRNSQLADDHPLMMF
jgi:hypothetical protein